MAVKGIRYLPNFDYLRIQTDILNIKTRSHTMDQYTDVDDCYYHRLSNLKTQYLDTYQLTDILNHHNTDFSLLHINSRSVKRNGNRANLEMDQLRWSFSIIAVTETWTSEENQSTVFFPGYKTCLKSRKNEAYRGVGLFLNEMLISNFEIVSYPVDELIMETLFVNITLGNRSLIVGVLYRPPNTELSIFNSAFDNLLMRLSAEKKPCYLLGDFDINLLKVAKHRGSDEFLNLLYSHSFYPLIDKPRRITPETATLIDNIFTNARPSSVLSASIWLTDISDHLPVCCQLDIKLHRPKSISVNKAKRSITEESLLHFKDKLGLIDWNVSSSNLDVNILYDNFSSKFSETYNLCFPLKKIRASAKAKNDLPWITPAVRKSIKRKNLMYKKFIKDKSGNKSALYDKYKTYRNRLTSILRAAEKS